MVVKEKLVYLDEWILKFIISKNILEFPDNLHKANTYSNKKFIFLCDFTSLANATNNNTFY